METVFGTTLVCGLNEVIMDEQFNDELGLIGVDPFIFSNEVTRICQWIIFTCICQLVDIFGIVTNIMNIICFVKQGFNDAVNISLIGLALADLGCLTTLIWTNICFTPDFAEIDLPFDAIEISYLTSTMPNTTFIRVSAWITAIVTLERCLCITAPLKVKSVITPRRVSVLIASIFLILIASTSPLYIVNRLGIKYYPNRNKTLLGLTFTEDREHVEKISFAINNIFIPFGAFSVITICTIILKTKLRRVTAWRNKSTSHGQGDIVSMRNHRVAKMVVMISTLFIACFVPISVMFIGAVLQPEFSINGKYRNMAIIFGGMSFLLVSINSSSNIFIYYHMSSKYRDIFNRTFYIHAATNVIISD